jgi:hypothetical protein
MVNDQTHTPIPASATRRLVISHLIEGRREEGGRRKNEAGACLFSSFLPPPSSLLPRTSLYSSFTG